MPLAVPSPTDTARLQAIQFLDAVEDRANVLVTVNTHTVIESGQLLCGQDGMHVTEVCAKTIVYCAPY